jgi:hypothetical protein
MSVSQLLFLALEEPYFDVRPELSRMILAEFWSMYMPLVSIDETVSGDMYLFSDMISQLPCMAELEYNFPGIKDYVRNHIRERDFERHDDAYTGWVAIGLLRFIGKDSQTEEFWYDAMG